MKLSSVSQLEAAGVRLSDTLSIDITLDEVTGHLGCNTEEVIRDGLGPFDFVVIYSGDVGFWAMVSPKACPEVGASVWAEPSTSEAKLINEVKTALKPVHFQVMRSATGELVI